MADPEHMLDEDRKDSSDALLPTAGAGAAAGAGVDASVMRSPGSKLAQSTDSHKSGAGVAMADRESVLLQVPAWASYVRAGNVSAGVNLFLAPEDVDALDEYEGVPPESMGELVEYSGEALANALVKVVRTITSVRVLRYALTLAEDLLTYDTCKRAALFVADGRLVVDPFFRCLSSLRDAYVQRQAAVVVAYLLRAIPEPEAASTLLSWILRQLRGGVPGHRSPELATAVAALSIMVRNNDLRDEFRDAHGIEKLIGLVQTEDTQMLYQVTFVLWVTSFDPQACEIMLQSGAVKALALNRPNVRLKVMRVAVAALANVARDEDVGAQCLTIMSDTPLAATLQQLEDERKVDGDEEMKKDVVFLREALEATNNSQSPFDRYCRELESGLLDWSTLHTTMFWRSHHRQFEARDFALLKRLGELLTVSTDMRTVAVVCYDLGEFARHHSNGRGIVRQLGLKTKLMEQLARPDPEVQKQALLACSKIMVDSWQFVASDEGSGGGGGGAPAKMKSKG